jgi:hypothetical protein
MRANGVKNVEALQGGAEIPGAEVLHANWTGGESVALVSFHDKAQGAVPDLCWR